MIWERATRGILFGAGMLCGIGAGHLFYLDRPSSGGAFLALTGMFLFFAQRGGIRREEEGTKGERSETAPAAAELALFIAEEAVNGLKRIGRSMPPTSMEVAQLEERMDELLDRLNVPATERSRLVEELEKLKGRARLDEGRRALSQSSRL